MRREQSTYTAKFNPENPGIGWTQSRDFGIPDPGINSLFALCLMNFDIYGVQQFILYIVVISG